MEQRKSINDAAAKDAQVLLRREECALGTEQRRNRNDAAVKDAEVLLCKWCKEEESLKEDARIVNRRRGAGSEKSCPKTE
jgi:hypothetical protein